MNIPYFELLDGVEDILDRIPEGKEIITICAKEGSSILVSEMLLEEGLDVSYLEGGMKAWSEYLYEVKVFEDEEIGYINISVLEKGVFPIWWYLMERP